MSTVTKSSQSAGLFVSAPPDAKPREPTAKIAKRQQISITIPQGMPRRSDKPADQTGQTGQTRAGLLLGDGI